MAEDRDDEPGMTDEQIEWLVDMATMAESLAAVMEIRVPVAMRTMLLAQRVQVRHLAEVERKSGQRPISLATMPVKGEPS